MYGEHSYEKYYQTNSRIVRKGQKSNVIVYHIAFDNAFERSAISTMKDRKSLSESSLIALLYQ